jgi:hypothetical protein
MAPSESQRVIAQVSALIVACTLLLTAGFVGLIAALAGELSGFESRIQWYVAVTAVVFVATIVLLELNDAGGATIITSATVVGVLAFVLAFLGAEGVLFTLQNPETVEVSRLVVVASAALVATGIGYWALRHWREFTADGSDSL